MCGLSHKPMQNKAALKQDITAFLNEIDLHCS